MDKEGKWKEESNTETGLRRARTVLVGVAIVMILCL